MLLLCAMVFIFCEELCKPRQKVVHKLCPRSKSKLETHDAKCGLELHCVPHEEEHEDREDHDCGCQKHGKGAYCIPEEALSPGEKRLHLRCHRIDELFSPVLGSVGLERIYQIKSAPIHCVLGLLSSPEVRQKDAPDADEEAEWDSCDVVRRASHPVDDLQGNTYYGKRRKPLHVEGHPEEVEANLVAKVVSQFVGEVVAHKEPLYLRFSKLLLSHLLVQWEVRLDFTAVKQLAHIDACAVLVLGLDNVVAEVDLVHGLEDRSSIQVVLRVRLVDVGDDPSILELKFRPPRMVMAELCVCVEVLLLHLDLVALPGCGVTQLLSTCTDLDKDFVSVAVVEAVEVHAAVLETLHDRLSLQLPLLHLVRFPLFWVGQCPDSIELVARLFVLHCDSGLVVEDHAQLVHTLLRDVGDIVHTFCGHRDP
mmetsp:Transcript_93432/g.166256  ORF Transcript_93432/g.166256 Transcript_93432/m.166256 type:complete len:423 (-) Transcript_93432:136-1404(-)